MIESISKYKGKSISCSKHAFDIMSNILIDKDPIDKDREHVWVINLNNLNKILTIELISLGTTNQSIVTPREVFCNAVRTRASKIIIVHNHPANSYIPSYSDISLTENLIQIGNLISIPVLDHIILTENEYFSFADCNLIDILTNDPFSKSSHQKRIEHKITLCRKLLKHFINAS